MPAIMSRIEKFFPELNINKMDNNMLLETIRVPNNLLFLTNKLPKPTYEIERVYNNTGQLPNIDKKSINKEEGKRKNRLIKGSAALSEINITKLSPALKKLKATYKKSLDKSINLSIENSITNQGSSIVPTKVKIKNIEINPSKKILNDLKVSNLELKKVKEDLIRSIRKKQKKVSNSVIRSNQRNDNSYIADPYIRQLIYKCNPILKPINHIRAGNIKELSALSQKLPKISRKMVRRSNAFPDIQRIFIKSKICSESFENEPRKPQLDQLIQNERLNLKRHKLVPIKASRLNISNNYLQPIIIKQYD